MPPAQHHPRRTQSVSSHLLERYVMHSLLWPTLQLSALFCVIMLLERGLRLLQEVAALGIPARYLGGLLLRLVPYYAQQALPFGFVIAVVMVLSRMARNREWEAMAGAGVSPARIGQIMTLAALLVAAATLVISGFLEPYGRHGYRRLHAVAINAARIGAIQPGAIYDQFPGVMLTAWSRQGNQLGSVFLKLADGPKGEVLATAHSARIAIDDDPPALVFQLEQGEMLVEGKRSLQFDRILLNQPITLEPTAWQRGRDARELTLTELVTRPPADAAARRRQMAEFYGKVARALGLLALPWLALPLLAGSRGERRWLAVATILFLVVAYYHAVNLSRNLAASGELALGHAIGATLILPIVAAAASWRLGSGVRQHAPPIPSIRLPHLRLPGRGLLQHLQSGLPRSWSHLLTGYLIWRLAAMTLVTLAGLVLLLQVVDLLERGEALVSAGQGLAGFARYAWLRLPATILQAAPLAMLSGALLAFALLRAGNELVVIHGLGISALGVMVRSLAVPLCFGLLLIGVSEIWAPRSQIQFAAFWEQVQRAEPPRLTVSRRWFRIGPDLVEAEPEGTLGTRLRDVGIYRFDGKGRLREWVRAENAIWEAGGWTLHQVERWSAVTGLPITTSPDSAWVTQLRPASLARFMAAAVPITSHDAWQAWRDHAPIDQAETLYETRVYMAVSLAIAPLLMLMLATALIVVPRQEVSLSCGLFKAATAGLAYLVLNGWLQVLGQSGDLPPIFAVTAAPLLFGVVALELILRAENRG